MGIGASIFLLALGAILAFAVEFDVSGLDINVIGWILMAVGVLGLVLTLVVWAPRRRNATVVQERRYVDDPNNPPPPAAY
jgi:hypothetical protein